MKLATDDPGELIACRIAFERDQRRFWNGFDLRKRRKRVFAPGEGMYFDHQTNERWMAWRQCWDYLRAPSFGDR